MMVRATASLLVAFFFFFFFCCWSSTVAQTPIPAKYDGFVYGDIACRGWGDSVVVEAFLDPMCPDSRDSWPPLKKALSYYGSRVLLIVHPFALPYHSNSYVACRSLHIANKLNSSLTYPLLELFFKYQLYFYEKTHEVGLNYGCAPAEQPDKTYEIELACDNREEGKNSKKVSPDFESLAPPTELKEKYYNAPTYNKTRAYIVDQFSELAVLAAGKDLQAAFVSGFDDTVTERAARISFKYGCSRGVSGTPFFFVNGIPLPDYGSALDFKKWRSIIDPLFEK